MHRVTRTIMPASLAAHAKKWTTELKSQLELHGGCYKDVSKPYKDRYRKNDIKIALRQMYNGLCCFCEGDVSAVSYDTIEHLRPKSRFPLLSFEWENLNYVCTLCNSQYKKDLWVDAPGHILDPSIDDIERFLSLNLDTAKYEAVDDNPRAKTTIDLTGINREELVKKRKKLILRHLLLIKKLKACGGHEIYLSELIIDTTSPYPTLLKKLAHEVLDSL